MRVAVLNDIHGNLPALEAVLDEVRAAKVDRIVAGGDVIMGPMPREVLERLTSCGVPVEYIVGNCEVAVLEAMAGKTPSAMPPAFQPLAAWNGERIGAAWGEAIARWPKTVALRVDGVGDVLFCHGTPRDENEIFTARTPDARLRAIVEGVEAPIVVCGHTHMPFDLTAGGTRIVNAGASSAVRRRHAEPAVRRPNAGRLREGRRARRVLSSAPARSGRAKVGRHGRGGRLAADVLAPRTPAAAHRRHHGAGAGARGVSRAARRRRQP